MPKLSILTLNAAIQDLRLFSRSLYCPVPHSQERLAALPEELRAVAADIVCLQEMFHPDLQHRLHQSVRDEYPFAAGFAATRPGLRLMSEFLVLSRFPINAGRLHRFAVATPEELMFTSKGYHDFSVTVAGLGTVEMLNFHLTAGGLRAHPQSPAMERIRERQVRQIIAHADGRHSFILAGDLNAGPQSSTHLYRQVLEAGYVDAFAEAGGDGISWDPANPLVAGGREHPLPPQRIDHVFLSRSLAERLKPAAARIVLSDCRVEAEGTPVPVSDHYGVLTVLEYQG